MTGDDLNVPKWVLTDLPVDISSLSLDSQKKLTRLVAELEIKMSENTSFKLNAGKRVGNYNLARCRDVTDEVDRVLSVHVGLADVWEDIELLYTEFVRTDFSEDEIEA
jgi:hypothetical protein